MSSISSRPHAYVLALPFHTRLLDRGFPHSVWNCGARSGAYTFWCSIRGFPLIALSYQIGERCLGLYHTIGQETYSNELEISYFPLVYSLDKRHLALCETGKNQIFLAGLLWEILEGMGSILSICPKSESFSDWGYMKLGFVRGLWCWNILGLLRLGCCAAEYAIYNKCTFWLCFILFYFMVLLIYLFFSSSLFTCFVYFVLFFLFL